MEIRAETQLEQIADEVEAVLAVSRPIIASVVYALRKEVVDALGGYDQITLSMLGRAYKEGSGDCGIAYEYAVHDAINRRDPIVLERIQDALKKCRITRGEPVSILFGAEKTGSQQLISTAKELLTDQSRVLSGSAGRPAHLKRRLNELAAAFRKPTTRAYLPRSINGLWKADLFVGSQVPDHWVGTSVKINPSDLTGASGLRIGIVPTKQGRSDAVRVDDNKNMVICPIPHDFSFMELFYRTWRIVKYLLARDFEMPSEMDLPSPVDREVARVYVERRKFPALAIVDSIGPLVQPNLLATEAREVSIVESRNEVQLSNMVDTVVAPIPRVVDN